jgi:hypothetical protein
MNLDPIIGHCHFADGASRLVYDDGHRQYVHDESTHCQRTLVCQDDN